MKKENEIFKEKQLMADTICKGCKYHAITWHQDLENLNKCLKCGGNLEIIAGEKLRRTKPKSESS